MCRRISLLEKAHFYIFLPVNLPLMNSKMEKMITGPELGICSPHLQILLQIPEQPVQIVWIIA